ncbi:Opioid growth factor receptor [Labeo rohita]|uniref:Opioid growth factor receptor n=1 Tax=Labeo rohita TaxID=84645 RepID=A0ABQ8L2R1_LABRO|nr:Opioid growth factor receptor [Labeo rohita]
MDPAVQIIILEQGNRSLEDHTRDFVQLIPLTHYPDSCLCTFYRVGLNITIKAQLSGEGPRESIADYIEWVLASCRSSWTIDFVKEDVSPTPDPEPSQPSPRQAELEPEPTADEEPEPRATEPEPDTSDQVREPDITSAKVECCVEQERAMESPAHCTTAGGEIELNSGDLMDFFTEVLETHSGDLIDFSTEISTCYDHPVCLEFPPTHPLLSTSMSVWPPLSPDSPSAHPQPTTCAVGSPRVCQLSSASWLEDPSAPPPASESRTPPRPSDPAAPPRLSAPSSPPAPVGPPAPPGSLVPPAPPWSVVVPPSPQDSTPPALPRRSVPPAPLGSSLPPAPPQSSVAPAPQRTSGAPPPPQSLEPWAPPWPSGSSVSPWIFGSPSPPRAPLPAAPPLSVGPLESATLPPPWLLPPSAPLWVLIMAAVWVCLSLSCSGSLLFPPWLLPPSSPPWTLLTLVCVPLPGSRPPPKPPPTWTLYRCLSPPVILFTLVLPSLLSSHSPVFVISTPFISLSLFLVLCRSLMLLEVTTCVDIPACSCLYYQRIIVNHFACYLVSRLVPSSTELNRKWNRYEFLNTVVKPPPRPDSRGEFKKLQPRRFLLRFLFQGDAQVSVLTVSKATRMFRSVWRSYTNAVSQLIVKIDINKNINTKNNKDRESEKRRARYNGAILPVNPVTYVEQSSRRVSAAVLHDVASIGLKNGSPSVVPEPPTPADQLLGRRDFNLRLLMFEYGRLKPVAYLEWA